MDFKEKVEDIARVAHEANRAYCLGLGDTSQPAWDDAPGWQKDSAIEGVLHVLDNPHVGPEASHASWSKQKIEEGWKYGPVKDPEKKEHPCLVPYEALPAEQRMKDHLFLAVVKTLLTRLA